MRPDTPVESSQIFNYSVNLFILFFVSFLPFSQPTPRFFRTPLYLWSPICCSLFSILLYSFLIYSLVVYSYLFSHLSLFLYLETPHLNPIQSHSPPSPPYQRASRIHTAPYPHLITYRSAYRKTCASGPFSFLLSILFLSSSVFLFSFLILHSSFFLSTSSHLPHLHLHLLYTSTHRHCYTLDSTRTRHPSRVDLGLRLHHHHHIPIHIPNNTQPPQCLIPGSVRRPSSMAQTQRRAVTLVRHLHLSFSFATQS